MTSISLKANINTGQILYDRGFPLLNRFMQSLCLSLPIGVLYSSQFKNKVEFLKTGNMPVFFFLSTTLHGISLAHALSLTPLAKF
jgi:hypothetical protein